MLVNYLLLYLTNKSSKFSLRFPVYFDNLIWWAIV